MLNKNDLKQIKEIVHDVVDHSNTMLAAKILRPAFKDIDSRFDEVNKRFEETNQRLDKHDQRFESLESEMTRTRSLMVTKDYLDDKLADLRADLLGVDRQQEYKVDQLVDELVSNNTVSSTFRVKLARFNIFKR